MNLDHRTELINYAQLAFTKPLAKSISKRSVQVVKASWLTGLANHLETMLEITAIRSALGVPARQKMAKYFKDSVDIVATLTVINSILNPPALNIPVAGPSVVQTAPVPTTSGTHNQDEVMELSPPELPDLRPVNPTPFPTNPPRCLVNPPSHCNPVLNPVLSIPLPRNPDQFNPLPAQPSLDDIPLLANPFLPNALSPPNSHPNQLPANYVPLPVELIPLPEDPPVAYIPLPMEVDPLPMPRNPTPPNNYTPVMRAISSMANVPEFRILKQLTIAQIRMLLPGTGPATHVTKRVLIVQLLQCKLQEVADTFPNFRATMAKINLPGVTNMAQLKAATAVGPNSDIDAILISKINLL